MPPRHPLFLPMPRGRPARKLKSMRLSLTMLLAALLLASGGAASAAVPGSQDVGRLLKGIPQHGAWLGSPKAPVVLVEYVDLQCPYCAAFSQQTLPSIVRSHVRTGRVRVLFRGLAFVGPDSSTALKWTYGAGRQNKLWNVLELLYANQGGENKGWVTQPLLESVARSVPGLDLGRLRRDATATGAQIAAAATAARAAHVPGTPYLFAGRTLATATPLTLKSFDPKAITAQLDKLLKR
jgi:protein-disulfide isomerase